MTDSHPQRRTRSIALGGIAVAIVLVGAVVGVRSITATNASESTPIASTTTSTAAPGSSVVPPASQAVQTIVAATEQGELVSLDPASGKVLRTLAKNADGDVALSADGSTAYFSSNPNGSDCGGEIRRIATNGSQSSADLVVTGGMAAVNPQNTLLAYVVGTCSSSGEVTSYTAHVRELASGNDRVLSTARGGTWIRSVSWKLDGSAVGLGFSGASERGANLYGVVFYDPKNGNEVSDLAPANDQRNTVYTNPHELADGSVMVQVSSAITDGEAGNRVVLMKSDGTTIRTAIPARDYVDNEIVYASEDGNHLMYLERTRDPKTFNVTKRRLMTMDDGAEAREIKTDSKHTIAFVAAR